MDSLCDIDRQCIEDLNLLLRKDVNLLRDTERRQVFATRPLEKDQLRQDAEQVRESYNSHRKEYTDLLRQEIPTRFAPGEQAFIHTVVQQLNSEQLTLTRAALQEADRDPNNLELTQLSAELVACLPSMHGWVAAD